MKKENGKIKEWKGKAIKIPKYTKVFSAPKGLSNFKDAKDPCAHSYWNTQAPAREEQALVYIAS